MPAVVHRELYEWANIWWDHADDTELPRVLLIGDSIAVGYTKAVTQMLEGMARVDRLGTSRSINDPALFKEISYVLGEYCYRVIHFNNGLHGRHLPDDLYRTGLLQCVELLRLYSQGARLIWASSTPITMKGGPDCLDEERNAQVVRRNATAVRMMQDYEIPVNDLYQLVLGKPALRAADGFHYCAEGQEVLGQKVGEVILRELIATSGATQAPRRSSDDY